MIIFRYLSKEVFITLMSLTAILLLIFMSNQFVHYLNRAANGQIPAMFIVKLMMLELPNLMVLLLPLGFYISMILAYGRLYAENEMIVLYACGYGPNKLLGQSLLMAIVVMLVVAGVSLWAGPFIAVERAKLIRTTGVQTLIQTVMPKRFNAVSGGSRVFYIQSMNRQHTKAEKVFFAQHKQNEEQNPWDILWAEKAYVETDPVTYESYAVLQNGHDYQGAPGGADFQVADFSELKVRLPHPTIAIKNDLRTLPMTDLWDSSERGKSAELQWRLSIPLMVIVLTFIAVPLSRINPRSGKFSKLLPAILIYITYANFMFVARNWVTSGKVPVWLGMWWLHLAFAAVGIVLIWRERKKL